MKKALLFLFLLTVSRLAYSQSNERMNNEVQPSSIKRNSIYLELLGNGGLYSLNYDRILFHKEKYKISGRVGASLLRFKPYIIPRIPIEINFLLGKNKHHLEVGAGATYQYDISYSQQERDYRRTPYLWISGRMGYRYQRPQGGFFFRIGYTPSSNDILHKWNDRRALPINHWAGISIGYTLK